MDFIDFTSIETIAIALIGLIGALAKLVTPSPKKTLRDDIKADLEILRDLPAESGARTEMLDHIDAMVRRLSEERDRRRDPVGIVFGVCVILAASALGIWAVNMGGWAAWLCVPLAVGLFIFGSIGLTADMTGSGRKPKDGGKPG
ncbi:hypothetical protein [Marinitenerispora sediminis]|uniref:Uncharacterized protein n=1 Tax=Marinitenerispora sediminis TaxID=1931232 RepID=A0A368T1S7_9ACTN|nr:hypothetical protein [Marinitenerispora sediminis]RCV52738.1 hypothetical protein DEF28_12360 [Marinitenerispora sediminis]RCV54260.1 hypothetical protein DEF23_16225 [Marinitenerispora sediminis]RCV54833.1 hypothetical protein DEF24_18755 [Marinitenerispora sediminis]